MPVAAARLGQGPAMVQVELSPTDRARHTDREAGRRCTATQPAINRGNNPAPKIL